MNTFNVTNIVYDTDGQMIDLPTEMTIEIDDDYDLTDPYDLNYFVSNAISDNTGWLVQSFDLQQ